MNGIVLAFAALVPSLGVGLLFFVAMRYILRADRNEREALARLDAEENKNAAGEVEQSLRPGADV